LTSGGNNFYDFPQMQLIKYGAAMSFAFKEESNELVTFHHCCSAANLWVLTSTAPILPVNYWRGWYIAWTPWLKYWGGLEPLRPHEVIATDSM